jgi:hypothetical protein
MYICTYILYAHMVTNLTRHCSKEAIQVSNDHMRKILRLAQWLKHLSIHLARVRPWVQNPILQKITLSFFHLLFTLLILIGKFLTRCQKGLIKSFTIQTGANDLHL